MWIIIKNKSQHCTMLASTIHKTIQALNLEHLIKNLVVVKEKASYAPTLFYKHCLVTINTLHSIYCYVHAF